MFEQTHPALIVPENPNVMIWRYMDFTKYVSMLENKGLFFPRADKLAIMDPFEGSIPRANEPFRENFCKEHGLPQDVFKNWGEFIKWLAQWTFVNCWHMNEYESDAMWKLYSTSNKAIAIQSSYARLRHNLDNKSPIIVVQYIDYDWDTIPEGEPFPPFIYKRKSFEHERELRAIYQTFDIQRQRWNSGLINPKDGEWINVDLEQLIETVYVSPTSPISFRDLVRGVTKRYEINVSVLPSSLAEEPFF